MAVNANMIQRTFYLDPSVDVALERLAHRRDISKNELMRTLLQTGLAPYMAGEPLHDRFQKPEQDADAARGKVMRSIYLKPELEDFLRSAAFTLRTTKSQLMRQFIDDGLAALQADDASRESARVDDLVFMDVPVDMANPADYASIHVASPEAAYDVAVAAIAPLDVSQLARQDDTVDDLITAFDTRPTASG